MPHNAQTPKPVQGWFIPSEPTTPAKKKLPLPLRLALIAAALTAIVLASHGNTNGQPPPRPRPRRPPPRRPRPAPSRRNDGHQQRQERAAPSTNLEEHPDAVAVD